MTDSAAIAWLRLLRAGTLFSPAADVVAGACLQGTPWSVDLARAAGASVLVYASGMVLNDHADRREDAVRRPERPIPSGRISAAAALASGLGLMLAGVLLAPWTAWWAAIAALVLAYDYVGKRNLAFAAPLMGLLRGANLLGGAVFAARQLETSEAVWIAAACYAIYVVAITVLGALEDERHVAPRAVIGMQALPPLVFVLALVALPERWPALAVGLLLAAAFLARIRRVGPAWDQAAIRRSMMWLLLGTMAYSSLLCLGSGRAVEAIGIAAAILPARWIARRISLT